MTKLKVNTKKKVNILILIVVSILFIPKPTNVNAKSLSNNNSMSVKCHRKELEYYKYSVDSDIVKEGMRGNVNTNGDKIVFLTFDDGPSTTVTPEILDVLKRENVKATFFLLGNNIEANQKSRDLVRAMYENGHAIGNHTYTHKYNHIYPNNTTSIENYLDEIEKTEIALKGVLGENYSSKIIRMPGGAMSRRYYKDPNLNEFNSVITTMSINNIDWNASICDATAKKLNKNELVEATKKSIGNNNFVVLLMHDTYGKEETAKALPEIIHYLKNQGYEFRVID
ncbi:MAG: polysaccharide deacetylase family protein [Clostridium sp.]